MSAARACLVTGYIRLDLPNRSHDEYQRLGADLLTTPADVHRCVYGGVASACWHWRLSEGATLPLGNAEKDTRAFHAVMHEKTAWVADAAERIAAEVFVWMDYGILHVPGITPALVTAFLERAAWKAPRDRVGMASIWGGPPLITPVPHQVAWYCAGGVFTVPRHLALPWHQEVAAAAVRMRNRGWATWEVNDWSDAWRQRPDLVKAWRCDHDAALLENGP